MMDIRKKVWPPKSAFQKLKVEEEDEIVHSKPMRKTPRSALLENEADEDYENQSEDNGNSSSSGSRS